MFTFPPLSSSFSPVRKAYKLLGPGFDVDIPAPFPLPHSHFFDSPQGLYGASPLFFAECYSMKILAGDGGGLKSTKTALGLFYWASISPLSR